MKEEEIRKRDAFDKYLEMVLRDVENFFDFNSFVNIGCPACRSESFQDEFEKNKFTYVSCKKCLTLFVNPRPPLEMLKEFYSKSPSTSFWVNEFFKPVAEARREKIFIPRANYVSKIIEGNKKMVIGDIGAGFGIFLEELRKLQPENKYFAIEPSEEMIHICQGKSLDVLCSYFEDINSTNVNFDFLTAFELLEHLFDPSYFLEKAYSLLNPGGYLLLTTLNGMGFDILMLWEKSKSISPPHHLNFFNLTSLTNLLKRLGFQIIEASTPGQLDWDIVESMFKNENVRIGRFWEFLAEKGSDECKREFQDWILRNNLSSHMRVLARKLQ